MTESRLLDHPVQRLAWVVGLALLAAVLAAAPARAQSCPGADLVRSAVSSLNQAAGSPQAYAQVVDRYANVSGLAMFALGPYQRALPSAQRGEYVQLTSNYIGRMLAQQAGNLVGSDVTIQNCYTQGGHAYVDTSIAGRRVVWRVDGGQIADVNFGGMWLAPQLRTNFVSIIRRGGDVAALLQYLRSNSLALR